MFPMVAGQARYSATIRIQGICAFWYVPHTRAVFICVITALLSFAGLTSQDVNNTAAPLALKAFITEVYRPKLENEVLPKLRQMAHDYADVTMLVSTTHPPKENSKCER
jgi:hypothetical protein